MLRGEFAPFFQESNYRVIQSAAVEQYRRPRTEVKTSEEMLVALFLVKAGYYGGNIEHVYDSKVDNVFETYHYEVFMRTYEHSIMELNKPKGK